jgi:hypothetical protein
VIPLTQTAAGSPGGGRPWGSLSFRPLAAGLAAALLLGMLLAAAACGAASGSGTPSATMRTFMQTAAAGEMDAARAQLATDADTDQIDSLLRDFVLFEGFQELKVDKWAVYASPNSDRGKLTGSLSYTKGYTGKFEAEMVQGRDGWRISRLSIVVGRDKLQEYQPTDTPTPAGTPTQAGTPRRTPLSGRTRTPGG